MLFLLGTATTSVPNRLRSLYLFLIALFVLAVVAIPLAILSRSHSKRQAAVSRQQAAISRQQAVVEAIRRRGGFVIFRPFSKSDFPDVISIDLSSAMVDAELMQTLGQFTGIERLTLDGVKLHPEDYALLSKLPQLQSLSLTRSNITDASVSRLSLGLTSLSLKGTAVTDKSMARLAAMKGLVSLSITDTGITPDGLRLLEPLRSLKNLWVDDSCITAESLESLRFMQPQNVEVAVSEGMGQRTYELLSVCKGPKIRGHHRDGYVLWEADSAWSDTLAGVVEAVVSEIGLDSQQAARLLEALGNQGGWGATLRDPPFSAFTFSFDTNSPDRGIQIASVDEFIRGLVKCPPGSAKTGVNDYWAVRRFAREKFTVSDVPQLLAAIRAAQYSTGPHLSGFVPFLLVHYGIDNPEVLAELDRLLAHKESFDRATTICAFGYGGASPFYSREEWAASKAADAFAVPRLLRICKDEDEFEEIRDDARTVLVEIAHRRPEYAAEVIPVLVDLLDEEGQWHFSTPRHISRVDISRLAEVDTDAAIAVVPRLREMLKELDEQLAGAPTASLEDFKSPKRVLHRRRFSVLEALSATAHHNPALAHEIALEYLSRMENGQPIGSFATLLSPDTPEANRMVVMALLNNANVEKGEPPTQTPLSDIGADAPSQLVSIAKKIRDWRATKERKDASVDVTNGTSLRGRTKSTAGC